MNRKLLSTKLMITKPRKDYIRRAGLFELLDDLTARRLTVIKGTPGSGKTTLLTSYIEQRTLAVRWITLDDECNHIALFWEYVTEALSDFLGESTADFTEYLQINAGQNINEALKVLINSMKDTEDIVLVLDDFQHLNHTGLLKSFEYFLANSPPCFHVILLTREKPSIYLAGYELQEELLSIDEHDLALSEEEGIAFLKETLSLTMPDKTILKLVQRAEGWIGGLQLLAASQTTKTIPKHIWSQTVCAPLYDYITAEIFDWLSPNERNFLVLTSIPSYFNRAVAKYLLPDSDYDSTLSGLLGKNLMIQCVDEENGLFQYHNLFRDYLLGQFQKSDQELRTQIYRKLARVFHELGDSNESLHHLFLLEDYRLAMTRILELPASAAYYSYIGKVPVEKAVESFDFAFQKFFYHYYIYDYDTCTALYQKAMQQKQIDERYQAFDGAILMYGAETLSFGGDVISTGQIFDMDMLPLTRALVLTKNAAFLFHQDRYTAALEAVNESIATEKHFPSTYISYFNLTLKTQICEEMGLLGQALAVQEQTHKMMEKSKMLQRLHTPTFALTVAGLYMKQMLLPKAGQALLDNTAAVAERGGHLQLVYNYNCIEYLFLTGETEEAIRMLKELMVTEAYQDILSISSLLKHLYRAGAMTLMMQDQFITAYEAKPIDARSMNSRLLHAQIQSARGQRQRALFELDDVLQIARKQESHLKIVEATLQRLTIMVGYSQDLRRLTDLYKEALYYACENKICLPFVMAADTVAVIHQQYKDKVLPELGRREAAFHNDIVKMCITKDNCILSERELEIIQTIADGLSNSDIAKQLFISLPTVKTHISNIFRKLDVKSRLAALEKARQMGLVK